MPADIPPLLFEPRFGALHPANTYTREAVRALTGTCRVEIKRASANERRRGFYWIMLDVAAEALTDSTGFHFDQELLHNELKRRLELGETFRTPSGSTIFKPRSTSNRAMTEPERARWTDRCSNVLSHWLGVPITDLKDEVRRRTGEAA
jgi:hypothetical protein